MAGVLEGVRVLDFGRYIAAPYCAGLLADLGAHVVRIERPGGGDDRYLMPATEQGEGAQFLQSNRRKRSLTLDIASAEGRQVVRRLVSQADVVVANLSPKALEHFGLDYPTLRAIKEDIILTTVSAYGSANAFKDAVGYDGIGQAISGAVYLSGLPGQPYRAAPPYVDYATGLSCAYGTIAALLSKLKTGKGAHVEGSLASSAFNMMNSILIEEATSAESRVPSGNRSPIAGPSDIFKARDGWFIMQVIGQTMFERWTKLVERPDLLEDPRFASDPLRGRNGEHLSRIMAEWAAERTRDECLSLLTAANLAGGPVLSPNEIMSGHMGLADAFLDTVEYPGTSGIPIAKPPVSISGQNQGPVVRSPTLGEHTEEVLSFYGFSSSEIAGLRSSKTI